MKVRAADMRKEAVVLSIRNVFLSFTLLISFAGQARLDEPVGNAGFSAWTGPKVEAISMWNYPTYRGLPNWKCTFGNSISASRKLWNDASAKGEELLNNTTDARSQGSNKVPLALAVRAKSELATNTPGRIRNSSIFGGDAKYMLKDASEFQFSARAFNSESTKPPGKGQKRQILWKADSTSTFEVGTQIRAWTIHDEGMSTILDNMQSMAGINNVYMVVVMHAEHRPFQAPEFPHNPARDSWKAEDSRVTFFPDASRYGRVLPLLSDTAWIRETDWLQLMIDSCRARGLAVGAEVSHYPIPKSIIAANPDWQQKKIDGTSWSSSRFCPNSPEPRQYIINLFGDLAENYDLDYIQTCQHLFWHNDIDDGGTCFCEHCIAEANRTGFDLRAAIPVLVADKNAQPQRDQWTAFRAASTTRFYKDLANEIKRVKKNPKCHLRYNDTYPYRKGEWNPRDLAMYIDDVSQHLGSLVNQDHQEQEGDANETFDRRIRWLTTNRNHIGSDMPLICGIAPRMRATPELVKAGIKVALEHPANVDGLALKHYDGASFGLLRAFKQGMIDAGVQGLTPTIGKEFEEMELTNFERIDDYVEEWGIATSSTGEASYIFDQGSGIYDIRMTYFDEEVGHSKVSVFIANQEKGVFHLDEDSGCWRWRMFEDIQVNKNDEIKVIAEPDNGEIVRLDFIEFIAK